jgi:hypothetical protein
MTACRLSWHACVLRQLLLTFRLSVLTAWLPCEEEVLHGAQEAIHLCYE